MIRFVIDRLTWPRERAVALLESLDVRGLAHIAMDMRQHRQPPLPEYSPFAKGFEV